MRFAKSPIVSLFACLLLVSPSFAADWDPNDDSFDPAIKSVVIGDRSWIGDPSPFTHVASSRTGYTYVNATKYEGFDPSVVLSLMVPTKLGETEPVGGGMLMMNQQQTVAVLKSFAQLIEAKEKAPEPIAVKTMMEDADWKLIAGADEKGTRFLTLELKGADKTDAYRFSVNATKKLVGALKHGLASFEEK